ncbi:NACHT domain-containing protein [Actinosynnema sp. CS-041913]|uniref:NACHT domain-containing protein n=1 Tax=Actinosynnema sp. CS-041913 TaxID=3239917 RepID=UPI003D93786D
MHQFEWGEAAIVGLESGALKLGTTIATHAARFWLRRRRVGFERGASLAALAQAELKGPLQQRKLENLVERIGQQVAEQLAPVLAQRFGGLPDNEAEAAIRAVVDVLEDVDLSDEALLAADADAEVLAKRIRAQCPRRAALLSEKAEQLHELALDQACRHLVQVIRYLPSFQPTALAEVLSRLTAQSEQLELLLSRIPTTTLYAPLGVDRDEAFQAEYLGKLAATLDRLELLGLPGDEQPTLALTVAYLSLSVSGTADGARIRRGGRVQPENWFDPLAKPVSEDAEGVPVESAIGAESRVLLRGDAGSGKTTLLNWLAVRAARGELGGELADWNDCVPFVVRLRTFAEGDLPNPEDFVSQCTPMIAEVMPEGWVHRLLKAGRAMLLIDGVDEVPATRRRLVKSWLRQLLLTFPETRIVVTARTAAADSRWLADEDFSAVTLEPLNPTNILDFVARWHRAAELSGAEVADDERRLRAQLERPHLRQLAASPLLCAMLCALNLSHRSELPRNRMDLYAKALAMLLHLRDAERGIPGLLGDTEKRVLLRDLAWRLTLANKVEFSTADALGHIARKLPGMPNVVIEPKPIFDHLLERSGVLREPVPGRVDFVHRTFLEYLAADEAIQQHHVDTLIAHAHLDTWWETVVMACGHATAKQASELLTGIMDRSENEPAKARHLRLLAAACLETVRDVAPEVSARVDTMVERKLVPPRGLSETASLASIGHRVLRYLPKSLDELSEAKAVATVRAAALTGTVDALPLLAGYARDPRSTVQMELGRAWHYFDPERFAEDVLANSPLNNGRLTITSRRLVPYAVLLPSLTSLTVRLDSHETIGDLACFTGVPALAELHVWVDPSRSHDLQVLGEHHSLTHLRIIGLDSTGDLSPIADLPDLGHVSLLGYMDDGLAGVGLLKKVRSVDLLSVLNDSGPTNALRVFGRATFMNLSGFTMESVAPIVRVAGLKGLAFFNNVLLDYDLSSLAALDLDILLIDGHMKYSGLSELEPKVEILRH